MVSVSQLLTKDQNIDQQHQSMMMKKLLFAACKNYWENDRLKLSSTATSDLIAELRRSQPKLSQVRGKLERVVSNLNKPEKYYPVAEKLLGKISKLYGESIDEPLTTSSALEASGVPMDAPSTQNSKIAEIVQQFEQDRNCQRIHKMLFALTEQRWENNPETLSSYPLAQLVSEVYENCADLERLGISLLKIVKGLNKQGTYSKVSEKIIIEFAKLYDEDTQLEKLKSLVNLSKRSVSQAKATQSQTRPTLKVETETRKHNFNYNPYQVRQRVMKYTNPLRVKMLLYHTLNYNPLSTQQGGDDLLLKTYELDQMLMQVVREFKTLRELQDNLEATALAISSIRSKMSNVDENLQVAKAIAMSLKPLYETA